MVLSAGTGIVIEGKRSRKKLKYDGNSSRGLSFPSHRKTIRSAQARRTRISHHPPIRCRRTNHNRMKKRTPSTPGTTDEIIRPAPKGLGSKRRWSCHTVLEASVVQSSFDGRGSTESSRVLHEFGGNRRPRGPPEMNGEH